MVTRITFLTVKCKDDFYQVHGVKVDVNWSSTRFPTMIACKRTLRKNFLRPT